MLIERGKRKEQNRISDDYNKMLENIKNKPIKAEE